MHKKFKRRLWAVALASILTVGIILTTLLIGRAIRRQPTPLSALQTTAQNYGTIKLDCNYNEQSHTLAVNQTTTYINHSTQTLF